MISFVKSTRNRQIHRDNLDCRFPGAGGEGDWMHYQGVPTSLEDTGDCVCPRLVKGGSRRVDRMTSELRVSEGLDNHLPGWPH